MYNMLTSITCSHLRSLAMGSQKDECSQEGTAGHRVGICGLIRPAAGPPLIPPFVCQGLTNYVKPPTMGTRKDLPERGWPQMLG